MERKDLIQSPEYWITKIQYNLYECAVRFMEEKGYNRTQLAKYLGVSKSYVSQLLSLEYDHRLSKLIELSLKFGFAPKMDFIPMARIVARETQPYEPMFWNQSIVFKTESNITKKVKLTDSDYTEDAPSEPIKYCA